jgi:carboxyl-terminal processing protease
MKTKIGLLALLGGAFMCFVAAFCPSPSITNAGGTPDKEAVLIKTIVEGLRSWHFQPQKVDDDFSKKVYKLYLDRIDGDRLFLNQDDIAKLSVYETKLDDQAGNGTYEFFNLAQELMNAGIKRAEGFYKDIAKQPFNYKTSEKIDLSEHKPFAKTDAELKKQWQKLLTYEMLSRITDKQLSQENPDKDETPATDGKPKVIVKDTAKIKNFVEIEADAKKQLIKIHDERFARLDKQKREDRLSNYINCITNVFDPHTGYFEPEDKANFNMGMTGQLEGIGARLQTEGEFTKINEVVPGGPAWKQGELKQGDLILKVTQVQPNAEPVDVRGMDLNEVVKMIRGKKTTQVKLGVKQVDGNIKDIIITRDVVVFEETFAKALLINGTGKNKNDKFGYIKLPKFYADFDNQGGRNCSEDVANEIEKLKKDNVKGIILDLRDNGGGSLRDVVKMSGLFIEQGPIVQVKSRDRAPDVMNDEDPRVQYTGPLVVMVDEFSASASEILAAAIQDYGRGVIVGSNTYGKGTVQRFFDLDRVVRGNDDIKPLGEVKLTIQKFYRINGGSTQLKGVAPDIALPDNYQYLKLGEQDNDYPLVWTEIQPAKYSQNVTKIAKSIPKLRETSLARTKATPIFQKINDYALYIKQNQDTKLHTLNIDEYKNSEAKAKQMGKAYKKLFKEIPEFVMAAPSTDLPKVLSDKINQDRHDKFVKDMKDDVQLFETLHIIEDMAKLQAGGSIATTNK